MWSGRHRDVRIDVSDGENRRAVREHGALLIDSDPIQVMIAWSNASPFTRRVPRRVADIAQPSITREKPLLGGRLCIEDKSLGARAGVDASARA
jgi:hypothetical protein